MDGFSGINCHEATFGLLAIVLRSICHLVLDITKRAGNLTTKALSSRDDANGNQGGDQTVFDSGCAGFVLEETCKRLVI